MFRNFSTIIAFIVCRMRSYLYLCTIQQIKSTIMIAEFSIENFFSIKSVQKISFEPSADTFMSNEYSYEVKDGVRLLKVGISMVPMLPAKQIY